MLHRHLILIAVISLSILLPAAGIAASKTPAVLKSPQETTLDVKAKLDAFALDYVNRINRVILPNKKKISVHKTGKQYLAMYREVDLDTLWTEIYPSGADTSSYIGHITYMEKEYECLGDTKELARSGPFVQVRARQNRDLFRYDKGKWQY